MTADEPAPEDARADALEGDAADAAFEAELATAEPVDPVALLDTLAERPMELPELAHHLGVSEASVVLTLQDLVAERRVLDWGGVYAVAWRTLYAREPRRSLAYLGAAVAMGLVFVLIMEMWRG